jgi:hypothetical protein
MQYRGFRIPLRHGAAGLNHFLSTQRIIAVKRHLVPDGANSLRAISVIFGANAGTAAPGSAPAAAAGVPAAYASALALTAHAGAAGRRREPLRRAPVAPAEPEAP